MHEGHTLSPVRNRWNQVITMRQKNSATTALLTDDERRRALARILAAGLRRLQYRAVPSTIQNSPESAPNCLELPAEMRLSVHTS